MRPPAPRRPSGRTPARNDLPRQQSDDVSAAQEPRAAQESRAVREDSEAALETMRPLEVAQSHEADATHFLSSSSDTTDLGERLRERQRARRTLIMRRFLMGIVGAALIGGGVWAVFFSSLFAFSGANITLTGADEELVTAESVRAALAGYEGRPLPTLSMSNLAGIVEENVAVKQATVTRRWPTGVNVRVTMRQGIMMEAVGSSYMLVDDAGIAFQTLSAPTPGLPLVTLPEDRERGAGDIASVLGALDESTRSQISSMNATGTQVTFALSGGQTVKWGTRDDAVQKGRVLAVLLSGVSASVYDVSSPNHPVTS